MNSVSLTSVMMKASTAPSRRTVTSQRHCRAIGAGARWAGFGTTAATGATADSGATAATGATADSGAATGATTKSTATAGATADACAAIGANACDGTLICASTGSASDA